MLGIVPARKSFKGVQPMHQLLLILFSFFLSLNHHPSSRTLQAQDAFQAPQPGSSLYFPDRHELARVAAEPTASDSGYAGSECLSCQRMNVSYSAR
jgi:hypothetical protein